MRSLLVVVVALVLGYVLKELGFYGQVHSGVYQIFGFIMNEGVYYLIFFMIGVLFGTLTKN